MELGHLESAFPGGCERPDSPALCTSPPWEGLEPEGQRPGFQYPVGAPSSSSGGRAGGVDMAGVYQCEEASRWSIAGVNGQGTCWALPPGSLGAALGAGMPALGVSLFLRCRHLPPQPGRPQV